ncbi:hypothetical protein EDL79_01740 [Ehrlichia ruminantium]|uniref:Sec-independent protein translocase protein TatB n=1 Tax=Ehrlichia ruminantium TaxID=779 RepID=A0AAE6Q9Q0_EHRRU|nr:twin-arginine translocase TatA/TatE family subunit [Ehrlichia ruminantium]QGR02977.1 hypothetical protein EDL81_01745 [Ehrlichia ruminantium]QGR03902.1 hypothetical protein EDL80_01740 [Ehrlichia ruminantium]QGR04826.1 hypothetical protein EDL79_01740 [Ehrlichia ruminantium]
MFGIGISEIIVIILVACLVIDPKKLPFLAKNLGFYYRKFIEIKEEIFHYLKKICINDTEDSNKNIVIKKIIGNDGKTYDSYVTKNDPEKKEDL